MTLLICAHHTCCVRCCDFSCVRDAVVLESSELSPRCAWSRSSIGHVFPLLVAFWNDVEVGLSQGVPQLWVQRMLKNSVAEISYCGQLAISASDMSTVRSPE